MVYSSRPVRRWNIKPGEVKCEVCDGTGKVGNVRCKQCLGNGELDWIENIVGKRPSPAFIINDIVELLAEEFAKDIDMKIMDVFLPVKK